MDATAVASPWTEEGIPAKRHQIKVDEDDDVVNSTKLLTYSLGHLYDDGFTVSLDRPGYNFGLPYSGNLTAVRCQAL